MSESIVELILLILFVFFAGCILGYILHLVIAPGRGADTPLKATDVSDAEERNETVKMPERKVPTTTPQLGGSSGEIDRTARASRSHAGSKRPNPQANGAQPKGLPTPRGGNPDPLQRISGVGPKIESKLHELGVFHFDQIAGWSEEQEQWVDSYLKFKGRIGRDEWVEQARLLAEGREEEFASRYGTAEKRGSRSRSSKAQQP
jgi:predicted flap endonuclease-1-like 5' DNA nuclease